MVDPDARAERLHRCKSTLMCDCSATPHEVRCALWKGHEPTRDHDDAAHVTWPAEPTAEVVYGGAHGGGKVSARKAAIDEVAADVDQLCELLAAFVAEFQGDPNSRPNWQTVRWRTDMRLLLERGPGGRAKPEPMTVARVAATMKIIFREMATPKPGSTFCWAAQVRSPGSLREKWDKIGSAYRLEIASNAPRASVMTEGVFRGAFDGEH